MFQTNNKLSVITKKRDTQTVLVQLTVHTGANNESKDQKGIAHFLEHVVFEQTSDFSDAKQLSEYIDCVGGEMNAMTNHTSTTYYVKVPGEHIERALRIISQIVIHPSITDSAVKKEREIILRELDLYFDHPFHYTWSLFDETIFDIHPSKVPIIGTKKSLQTINKDQLRAFHSKYYVTQNATLCIVGSIPNNIKSLTEKYFGPMKIGVKSKQTYTDKPNTSKKIVKERSTLTQAYYMLGYKAPNCTDAYSGALYIIKAILSKGQSGLLFEEFRIKRGIAYSVFSEYDDDVTGSTFRLGIITNPEHIDLARQLFLEQLEKIKHIDSKTVAMAKKYSLGSHILQLDDLSEIASEEITRFWTQDKSHLSKIKNVSVADVRTVARQLFTTKYTEAIVLPGEKSQ